MIIPYCRSAYSTGSFLCRKTADIAFNPAFLYNNRIKKRGASNGSFRGKSHA